MKISENDAPKGSAVGVFSFCGSSLVQDVLKPSTPKSPVQELMDLAETTREEDRRTFSVVASRKDAGNVREFIFELASRKRQGELDEIIQLPAFITAELKKLPDRD